MTTSWDGEGYCIHPGHGGMGIPVVEAFAQGTKWDTLPELPENFTKRVFFWGFLRTSPAIIARGKPFLFCDYGYFRRKRFTGYYKVVPDAFQHTTIRNVSGDRARAIGIPLAKWRKGGSYIVVCPPSEVYAKIFGLESWLQDTLSILKKSTKRKIIIRPKSEAKKENLPEVLKNAHCLVTPSSNAAVEALQQGVPVSVCPLSAAWPLSTPLESIEDPVRGDREQWANSLAHGQFTLDEMRSGLAWEMIKEALHSST